MHIRTSNRFIILVIINKFVDNFAFTMDMVENINDYGKYNL